MKNIFLHFIKKNTCHFAILLLLSIMLTHQIAFGQEEENRWVFGYGSGMDFTSGSPVGSTSNITLHEGSASICDASGQLLFYTNGLIAYNRNHEIFPEIMNGVSGLTLAIGFPTPLMPGQGGQATQPAVIAAVPSHPGQYYIFSLGDSGGALYYSIVDMSLHNGLGGIVTGKKGIFITSGLTGKMTVVKGCNNIWLMVRSLHFNQWKAFEINDNGVVMTPVVSNTGSLPLSWYRSGVIKFSPDGSKMAAASNINSETGGGLELYDFDMHTGKLTNPIVLDSNVHYANYYGACFSPDNTKLYASKSSGSYNNIFNYGTVHQFDLGLPSASAIIASNTVIFTDTTNDMPMVGDIKRGKNNKIYFGIGQGNYFCPMHCINNPNLVGLACNLQLNAVMLPPFSDTRGLPNDIAILQPPDTIHATKYTSICFKESGYIIADSGKRYQWMDGSTNRTFPVDSNGVYVVQYINQDCRCEIDSIHLRFVPLPQLNTNGYSCPYKQQGIAWFSPIDTTTFGYQWKDANGNILQTQTGTHGDTLRNIDTGLHYVQVTASSGCDTTLAIIIKPLPVPEADFIADTVACKGVPVSFINISSQSAVSSEWQFGDGNFSSYQNPDYAYGHTGDYIVSLTVTNIEGCSQTIEKAIKIKGLDLNLTASKDLIDKGEMVEIRTSANEAYAILSWQPSVLFPDQASLNQYRKFDTTQTISVKGISPFGCTDIKTIKIAVNPVVVMPTAFSPNGDGLNDRFCVNNSGEIFVRHFEVFNRFGQQVYSAFGAAAKQGWDGTFKGQIQDTGVYYYIIEIETKENNTIILKGDVTLIR